MADLNVEEVIKKLTLTEKVELLSGTSNAIGNTASDPTSR